MESLPFIKGVETRPTDALVPYAKNARVHDDNQIAKLTASIGRFGFNNPVLIDKDDGIIAGHGRVLAAQRLGLKEVPVALIDHLTEDEKRAYIIADNKLAELASWDDDVLAQELNDLQSGDLDFDLDNLGFDEGELTKLMDSIETDAGDGGVDDGEMDDVVTLPPVNPVSKLGDLWIMGNHRLLCGDSTKDNDVKRLMAGERAILFATDPPYLVDYDGTNHPPTKKSKATSAKHNKDWSGTYGITWDDSNQGPDLYRGFIKAALDHAIDDRAAWYCWHASKRQAMLESVWDEFNVLVHQQIIWLKDRPVITRSHYLWKHEPCLFGWIKGNKPPRLDKAPFLHTIWQMKVPDGAARPEHPTPKPLNTFMIPMRQHVKKGGLCYEPFSGSGSQIIAGEKIGRRVYAMEISPNYVDVAIERWQKMTRESAILDGTGKVFEEVKLERLSDDRNTS